MTLTTLLLIAVGLILTWTSVAIGLAILERAAVVLKQVGIDLIEIYARATQAKIDAETRQAKLDYWIDYAQATLHERRQKLLGGEK